MAPRKLDRRRLLALAASVGVGATAGCLRAGVDNSDGSGTSTETPAGTLTGTRTQDNEETATPSEPEPSLPDTSNLSFTFDYFGGELTVTYASGESLPAESVAVRAGETSATWDAVGPTENGSLVEGTTVTLTESTDNWGTNVSPSTPVTVVLTGEREQVVASFDPGGNCPMARYTPENQNRNLEMLSGGEPSVRWRFEPPDGDRTDVLRQPVVDDGTIYVGTYNRHFYAIDLASGEPEWHFDAPAPGIVSDDDTIAATVAVDEDSVYIASGNSTVGFAVDRETGEQVWESEAMGTYSPTLVDGRLYSAQLGSGVKCLDADSGEQLWRSEFGGGLDIVPAVADGTVVSAGENGVYAFDAESGDRRWRSRPDGLGRPAEPTIVDGTVLFGEQDTETGRLYAVSLADGSEQWRVETETGSIKYSPAVAGSDVYLGTDDGVVHAIDREDRTVRWSAEVSPVVDTNRPTVTQNAVFVGTSSDEVISLSRSSGTERWRREISVVSPPTVVDNTVVLGSDSELVALEERV
jgi:outer membrane protein assembly factor BamB